MILRERCIGSIALDDPEANMEEDSHWYFQSANVEYVKKGSDAGITPSFYMQDAVPSRDILGRGMRRMKQSHLPITVRGIH